jgi:hypothetical protein
MRVAIAAAVVAAAAFSCASAPEAKKAPSWTLQTPAPDATYTYFVGYADGGAGQTVQATDAATAGLLAEIMRYIGVTITSESSATAKATLDSFQADIVQTVKQSSTSRVAGFQVAEKYVASRKDGVTVYLLGRFETRALEGERKRIAAVFQEKIDAVARPEAEAKALLAAGNVAGAAKKFIEAAVAASGSDIENSSIKVERNLNAAVGAVAQISLTKLNDRLQAYVGGSFPEPFKILVRSDAGPVPGVPVLVSHQAKLPNGRLATRTVSLTSGTDGVVSFVHPTPDFVGKATLTARLDLSAATEPLYGVPEKYKSLVAGLEDEIAAKRVAVEYSVVSKARSVPTAVLVADLDAAGTAAVGTTSSAVVSVLAGNGFVVSSAPLAAEAVVGKDDAAVLAAARDGLGAGVERFAYGVTRIVSVRDDNGQKIATVSSDVKVVELSSGRMLYSAVRQASAVSSNERQAVDAARRQLGQKAIGEDMASSLP